MSAQRKPTPAQVKRAADRIRNGFPVQYDAKGKTADAQISAQNKAIRDQLEAWGLTWSTTNEFGRTVEGRHVWHTALVENELGPLSGRWGDNPIEVELHLRMFTECADRPAGYFTVIEDADARIYNAKKAERAASEKQARAIQRKLSKTKAKYTDKETTHSSLEATKREGMLF